MSLTLAQCHGAMLLQGAQPAKGPLGPGRMKQACLCFTDRRGSERCRSLWSDQGYLSTRNLSLGTSAFPRLSYSVLWFVRTRAATHTHRTPCRRAFQGLGGSVLSQESPEILAAS